jgi:GMP synthase-like glutamine amidotransferase
MLNADVPVPTVFTHRAPTYGRIFHKLLAEASSSNLTVTSTDFDVVKDEYPTSLAAFDVIIISGSANAAYEDLPWIRKLDAYVCNVYEHHPHIKIFGSCFGHQLICQSLLREYGVRVEEDPNGFEIGVKEVRLTKRFREVFGERSAAAFTWDGLSDENMKLQFIHHDHVVIPEINVLPATWIMVGSTDHCNVQGVYQPGRVLTLQGHFEFDRFISSESIKHIFGTSWSPEDLQGALEAIDADDNSKVAARMLLGFFLECNGSVEHKARMAIGGLLTPPNEQ